MKLIERMVYFVVDNQIYDFVPEIWSSELLFPFVFSFKDKLDES